MLFPACLCSRGGNSLTPRMVHVELFLEQDVTGGAAAIWNESNPTKQIKPFAAQLHFIQLLSASECQADVAHVW